MGITLSWMEAPGSREGGPTRNPRARPNTSSPAEVTSLRVSDANFPMSLLSVSSFTLKHLPPPPPIPRKEESPKGEQSPGSGSPLCLCLGRIGGSLALSSLGDLLSLSILRHQQPRPVPRRPLPPTKPGADHPGPWGAATGASVVREAHLHGREQPAALPRPRTHSSPHPWGGDPGTFQGCSRGRPAFPPCLRSLPPDTQQHPRGRPCPGDGHRTRAVTGLDHVTGSLGLLLWSPRAIQQPQVIGTPASRRDRDGLYGGGGGSHSALFPASQTTSLAHPPSGTARPSVSRGSRLQNQLRERRGPKEGHSPSPVPQSWAGASPGPGGSGCPGGPRTFSESSSEVKTNH
ncbi:uncharacterized protein LOC141558713 [Sminthopsis crassicaudata]|uniref:uncharacterized protein LOC141558713 n=1 Tax=Sminthopsis crassicaudata TaxID=9301 RepID=UPI003D681E1A